jgi:hypothetical protein
MKIIHRLLYQAGLHSAPVRRRLSLLATLLLLRQCRRDHNFTPGYFGVERHLPVLGTDGI